MQRGDIPYKSLGRELQRIREALQESAAEVSGAIEIDIERLGQFERGDVRPTEDLLLLLITHFGIKDEAAAKLWELAGYDDTKKNQPLVEDSEHHQQQQAVMLLPIDSRIVYTDMINVTANNYGVVMNFMQSNAVQGQPLKVSRVGMSIEHAKSVLDVLSQAIDEATRPKNIKNLPAPKSDRSRSDKK